MNPDIASRKDIKLIITEFYDKITADKELRLFFQEIITDNHLEHHIDIIVDFWEDLMFQTYNYKNNPMQKHLDFIKKVPFTKNSFKVWLYHFNTTIDIHFSGNKSNFMKNRANSIATVMQLKMNLFNN